MPDTKVDLRINWRLFFELAMDSKRLPLSQFLDKRLLEMEIGK